MKTIQEQIEVMQHYANGGEIEIFMNDEWKDAISPGWNWSHCDYRTKEQKKTITIEKWLFESSVAGYSVIEGDKEYVKDHKKIKLLETYEVEL